jgi:protein PhnA
MKDLPACPGCRHDWTGAAPAGARVIRDFVGNPLTDGDTVTVIRDLKVKG